MINGETPKSTKIFLVIVFPLFVVLVISLFASLGWRSAIRDAGEAFLLLFLFTVWLWGERALSPMPHRNWFLVFFFLFTFYGLLQISFHPEISFATRQHALRFPCYFIAASFAFYFCQREASLNFLLSNVSVVGSAFAVLILVLRNISPYPYNITAGMGLSGSFWPSHWLAVPYFDNWVSPYFYVNTLAYFFELIVFIPLGLLFYRITNRWEQEKNLSAILDQGFLFWAAVFLSILGILFVLLSRASLIAFFGGLFLFFSLLSLKKTQWVVIVFFLLASVLCWSGIQSAIAELGSVQGDVATALTWKPHTSSSPQIEAWQTLTRIFISNFWLGSGPGSYPILYFAYKPASAFPLFSLHGYNDALQLLGELGVIGGALFLATLVSYLFYFLRTVFIPYDRSLRFFGASAITCGITAVFIHSFVESGLQYFSIACLTALMAGACMGTCQNPEERTTKQKKILLLIVTAGVFLLGVMIFRWWIIPWSKTSGDPLTDALAKVRIDPGYPDHHARLGDLYLAKALSSKLSGTAQKRAGKETHSKEQIYYLEMARQEYEMIKKLNPYPFEYYDKMARLYIEQNNYAAASQILKAWEAHFPNAADVKAKAAPYYLEIAEREKSEH